MATIGLINPCSKIRNYQELAPLSAVMPPHWLLVKANYYRNNSNQVKVFDCSVSDLDTDYLADCDRIEILPSGVHPHAFIQEQAGVDSILEAFPDAEVVTRLSNDVTEYGPAWDLINPFDYRCHNWQAWGRGDRTPYGTLSLSVSCPYSCSFCNIRQYYGHAYKEVPLPGVMHELNELYSRGIRNIKMMDELFVFNRRHMEDFCNAIITNGWSDLNIWGYARVDSVKRELLPLMRSAGIRWLCLGIESGSQDIRISMNKGRFSNTRIYEVVDELKAFDISILGNFMFGFPDDTLDTMQETFDLAMELQCEYSNFYCMVPYPGTGIADMAAEEGWTIPDSPSGYSQYAYDFQPLPTHHLSATEVLAFRDDVWHTYHTDSGYLDMMETKFGQSTRIEIESMARIQLKRRILE